MRFVFLLSLLTSISFLTYELPAQDPAKKPPIEEEEEPGKRKLGKPPAVDADVTPPSDLLLESVRATNPDVKDLFRRMAVPHDVIDLTDGRRLSVVPIPNYLGEGSTVVGLLKVKPFDDQWKAGEAIPVKRSEIKTAVAYEQSALKAVDEFLQSATARRGLTPVERLDAAEKVLAAALRFHRPSPDRSARDGSRWKDLETRLQSRLLDVRVERLQQAAVGRNWEEAFAWGDQLTRVYGDAKTHERIVQELAKLVDQALRQGKYDLVLKQLRELERFPNSAAVIKPISEKLRAQAADLLKEAQLAKESNDPAKANELVNKADRVWPRLEGLRDFRSKLNQDRPTLGVGVRELPEFLSPGTAVLDSEKRAVELMFESLVEAHDLTGGQTYEPTLAVELPKVTTRGREYRMDPEAYWSNGERVTAADVRHTVQMLAKPSGPRRSEWANMLEPPMAGRDPSMVSIGLRQGFIDPLSLMTFKILPSSLAHADDPRFGKQPIGSGPYQLADQSRLQAEQGAVIFVANENYRRARKPEMPHIHEVRFYPSRDPLTDFAQGRLHLLLDVSAKQAQELTRPGNGLEGTVQVQVMRNRRIYFLAVNHRRGMLQNTELRKAIAHAINRTQILQDVFRGEWKPDGEPPHRPLNGPFPPGSWACDPSLRPDPFQLELAKQEAEAVRKSIPAVRLSLKYPEGDDAVKEACTKIRDQVQSATGFEIELAPRPARLLRNDVEMDHDYDLAYYSHDYPSEAYFLWPLFNPDRRARERGGENYLGYHNDGSLERWFHRAIGHREFAKVRECTHKIHSEIWARMPLIPLWQLDTVVAVHRDLTPVRMDPLLIFTDVERWKLRK